MHLKKATACLALASVGMLGASLAPAAGPTAYVTSETAGVGVIDLDQMTLAKTFSFGDDGPRGLSLTADGRRLLLANKKPGDLSEVDTATGKVLRRVKIGQNPEFVRVYGGYAYVTYEPGENGGPATGVPGSSGASGGDKGGPSGAGKDDDNANEPPAEIAIVDLKTLRVVRSVKSGHETEGVEFSGDGKELLVTNEGDDTVSVYHVGTGAPLRTLKLDHGRARAASSVRRMARNMWLRWRTQTSSLCLTPEISRCLRRSTRSLVPTVLRSILPASA